MERGEVVKMMIEASAGVNRGIDDFFLAEAQRMQSFISEKVDPSQTTQHHPFVGGSGTSCRGSTALHQNLPVHRFSLVGEQSSPAGMIVPNIISAKQYKIYIYINIYITM
jgi:hypothetical protein